MMPVRNVRVRLIAGLDLIGADEIAAPLFFLTAAIAMILVAALTGGF